MNKKQIELDKEKIATLYESGNTTEQIGKLYGVTAPTIRRFMQKHDIEIRKSRSLLTKKQKQEAFNMRSSGLTIKEIAKSFNVGSSCIHNSIKKDDKKRVAPSAIIIDSDYTDYKPTQFIRKRTQVNDELNLYIPEKWKR